MPRLLISGRNPVLSMWMNALCQLATAIWLLHGFAGGLEGDGLSRGSVDYGDCPAPIGAVYTGLITTPCAPAGKAAVSALGQNMESDCIRAVSRRNPVSPGKSTFLATVEPASTETRYEDTGLKTHTVYYYRVRARTKPARPQLERRLQAA